MITNIEIYRKRKGYSARDLAEIVGVSPMSVSYWERLKLVPSIQNFMKLCRALDATVDELWQPEWESMPNKSGSRKKRKECS